MFEGKAKSTPGALTDLIHRRAPQAERIGLKLERWPVGFGMNSAASGYR